MQCCPGYKLNKKFSIYKNNKTPDTMGGNYRTWVKYKDVWCDCKQLNAGEKWRLERIDNLSTHKIVCRFDSQITDEMILERNGFAYRIINVYNIEDRNKYLELRVEKNGTIQDYGL